MLNPREYKQDPRTAAKRVEQVRQSLRDRLLQETPLEQLELVIVRYLNQFGDRLPVKQVLARKLAQFVRQNWPAVNAKDLNTLIDRRPQELNALLKSIDFEDLQTIAEVIATLSRTKRKRVTPLDDTERQRSRKRAKNRYDRGRRYHQMGIGHIEREFGLANPFSSLSPLVAPCLDNLFQGGEVKMAGDLYCLEDLFGMDRHNMPRGLPTVRRGRERGYNLEGVLECMRRALSDCRPGRRWLPDPMKRKIVLAGIIARAETSAPQPAQTAVRNALGPFLT